MEIVFVDVKHCDLYLEENGVRIRPALIGFHDAGTGRLFAYLVRTTNGKAVSKQQVFDAFGEMLITPDWGVPKHLYTDNGTEMHGLDEATARLKTSSCFNVPIARALPYSPRSRPIEGLFAAINRQIFATFPGFTGGKPHKLLTSLRDRRSPLQPGSWQQFAADFSACLVDYHSRERARTLSPQQRFETKLAKMRTRLNVLDRSEVAVLLGENRTVKVKRGKCVFQGRHYHAPELLAYHDRRVLIVKPPAPLREGGSAKDRLPYAVTDNGVIELLFDELYHPLTSKGTKQGFRERQRRWATFEKQIRARMQEVDGQVVPAPAMSATIRRARKVVLEEGHLAAPSVAAECTPDQEVSLAARRIAARSLIDAIFE